MPLVQPSAALVSQEKQIWNEKINIRGRHKIPSSDGGKVEGGIPSNRGFSLKGHFQWVLMTAMKGAVARIASTQ